MLSETELFQLTAILMPNGSQEIRDGVQDMLAIMFDPQATSDERQMAFHTIQDARDLGGGSG